MEYSISPVRGLTPKDFPWEGDCPKKPWDYEITAAIPVLDSFDCVELCVDLLRLQTVRPFIILIDTGSTEEQAGKIAGLRDIDLEVHSLRLNGVMHPSDYPAIAMDLAFSMCRTPFLYATHLDCFLRRRNFLEDMLNWVKTKSPVVGYEISPRSHADWKGMVSHTASIYHMETMDKIGFGWSLRRLCNLHGLADHFPNPETPNWPDTEILGNVILRHFKIEPHLIGQEKNFCRNLDESIDHCRSIVSGRLYSPLYEKKAKEWLAQAKKEAKERIELWKKE
jgi:hypothetical protein